MRKLVTLTLAVLMLGLFAAVVFAAVEAGDDSSSTVRTTETSPITETTERTTTPNDRGGQRDRGKRRSGHTYPVARLPPATAARQREAPHALGSTPMPRNELDAWRTGRAEPAYLERGT